LTGSGRPFVANREVRWWRRSRQGVTRKSGELPGERGTAMRSSLVLRSSCDFVSDSHAAKQYSRLGIMLNPGEVLGWGLPVRAAGRCTSVVPPKAVA
jgi:hypothetical protein